MFNKIFKCFRPAPYQECHLNQREISEKFLYWRLRIFYSIYIGYVFFYFTRKSFTFAMPMMIEDLNYSKAEVGFLGSVLYVTYGFSKFASGILSDRANPRYFMAVGLICTGIINILFGTTSSLFVFALLWAANGFFQGWGWPPCTKQLTYWFSKKERGFWWSLKSTSHNVGGALIPLLVTLVCSHLGWRWSMYIPGAIAILCGLYLLERLRDVPRSLGLPTVEEFNGECDEKLKEKVDDENLFSVKNILFKQVLSSKAVWVLALSYFFVYVVRTGINDWGSLYLHKFKGYSLMESAGSIAWFEVGGFFGCLAAGWGSDRFFQGRRIPFMLACAIGLVLVVSIFWWNPTHLLLLDSFLMALMGFLIFGPQMLVGLAAAELVDKKAACTANGFAGCFAYIGAAATGYPLGKVIDIWGWQGYIITLILCSAAIFLILFPLSGRGNKYNKSPDEQNFASSLTT